VELRVAEATPQDPIIRNKYVAGRLLGQDDVTFAYAKKPWDGVYLRRTLTCKMKECPCKGAFKVTGCAKCPWGVMRVVIAVHHSVTVLYAAWYLLLRSRSEAVFSSIV